MDRFDFTKDQRDLLNLAVKINVVDAVELGCMMSNVGVNFDVLCGELTETAFTNIHSESRIHTEWVTAVDAFNAKRFAKAAA
jgi:hypothetical protein